MHRLTSSTAIAASADTGAYTASWWATLALPVAFLYYVAFYDYRIGRRWKVRRGIRKAPFVETQETQIREIFDGNPIVTIDPRRFTITVARMNGIAKTYGYHYIGECGHAYGSTQVAFQFLPYPLPLRIPTMSTRWRPVSLPPIPTATHPPHPSIGAQQTGNPHVFRAQHLASVTHAAPHRELYRGIRQWFDGRDLVRVRGPWRIQVYLAEIAYGRGYAFAWSYMPSSRSSKNAPCFCFRRLYPAE